MEAGGKGEEPFSSDALGSRLCTLLAPHCHVSEGQAAQGGGQFVLRSLLSWGRTGVSGLEEAGVGWGQWGIWEGRGRKTGQSLPLAPGCPICPPASAETPQWAWE